MFRSPRSVASDLSETASYKLYVDLYTQRVGLTENKLAFAIRDHQQRLNNISNGNLKNVDVETLVKICLVLGLNEEESVDLMARRERALSPADPVHRVYWELICLYSKKEINYNVPSDKLENILNDADQYLKDRGLPPFKFRNVSLV